MHTRPRLLHGLAAALIALSWHAGLFSAPPAAVAQAPAAQAAQRSEAVALPNRDGSLKFAVLGDFGTGDKVQYETADQMAKVHERFPYEMVITVGDNLYGTQRPQDFKVKFEDPYKALLDAKVKFYASLGNHDDRREQTLYKLFNMEGKQYYSFKAPKQNVRFFALESSYLDKPQIAWVERELQA